MPAALEADVAVDAAALVVVAVAELEAVAAAAELELETGTVWPSMIFQNFDELAFLFALGLENHQGQKGYGALAKR